MINQDSLQAVASARINGHIGKPLYDSYCFSQIPQTIYHLLTGEGNVGLPTSVLGDLPRRYNQVILLFIDAFGWRFFEQYWQQSPFLRRFVNDGVVSQLTTQFPSTTAAHVTTINSGLPVGESGVYEWYYYEPQVDAIISPLLFSFAGDKQRNTLKTTGISPQKLFPTQTIYQKLQHHGVQSYCFQHQNYAFSPFSQTVCNGATFVPYKTLPEALVNLSEIAIAQSQPAYYYFYVDSIDSIGHRHGPNSPQFEAEVSTFLMTMEHLFHASLSGKLRDTLVLMTADHGQTKISPEATIYLNQLVPEIEKLMKTNAKGQPLVPAGSCRDLVLYIEDDSLDLAESMLTEKLAGHATVYRTKKMIEEGYFGSSQPSNNFLNRLGNLLVLPHQDEMVWWYEPERFKVYNQGHHGGLSAAEMETILLALPYD